MFALIGFIVCAIILLILTFITVISLKFGGLDSGPLQGQALLAWTVWAGVILWCWYLLIIHSPFTYTP